MAKFEDVLQCAICLDRMKQPKMLQCQHTFCKTCLEKMDGRDSITCPECRTVHYLDNNGVNGLPNNLTITKLLDVPTENKSIVRVSCQDCKKNNIQAECRHCDKIVCRDCLIKHTRTLNDEFQQAFRKVEELLPAISAAIPNSKEDHETLKKNVEAVRIRTEINEWRSKCMAELQNTTKRMLRQVADFEKKEIGPYEELEKYHASIQSIYEIAKKKSQEFSSIRGTDASIQDTQCEMMDLVKKCNECATRNIVGVVEKKNVTTLQYQSGISDCITGLVSNLKEIGFSPPLRFRSTPWNNLKSRSTNIEKYREQIKTLTERTEEVCRGEATATARPTKSKFSRIDPDIPDVHGFYQHGFLTHPFGLKFPRPQLGDGAKSEIKEKEDPSRWTDEDVLMSKF